MLSIISQFRRRTAFQKEQDKESGVQSLQERKSTRRAARGQFPQCNPQNETEDRLDMFEEYIIHGLRCRFSSSNELGQYQCFHVCEWTIKHVLKCFFCFFKVDKICNFLSLRYFQNEKQKSGVPNEEKCNYMEKQ